MTDMKGQNLKRKRLANEKATRAAILRGLCLSKIHAEKNTACSDNDSFNFIPEIEPADSDSEYCSNIWDTEDTQTDD
jgi:hypothetical protein